MTVSGVVCVSQHNSECVSCVSVQEFNVELSCAFANAKVSVWVSREKMKRWHKNNECDPATNRMR
jgi:hypothetical protein